MMDEYGASDGIVIGIEKKKCSEQTLRKFRFTHHKSHICDAGIWNRVSEVVMFPSSKKETNLNLLTKH
jgi:hypothetical protein